MIDLVNITFICLIFVLFIIGLVWKNKIEKESDFTKRINRKFILKYTTLAMLILGTTFVIFSYILTIVCDKIGKHLLFFSFAFLLISVEWAYIFDKINIYCGFSKEDIVEQYILFFTIGKISNTKYLEVIAWFSRWNHQNFLIKNSDEQDVDKKL